MKAESSEIKIDAEFRALIPPLSSEEFAQLEANIVADGCRDPLVIWNGTLIDGHNRFAICEKHGLGFDTTEQDFANRDEAKKWIILNQFGRRNLTTFARAELALKLEPIIADKARETYHETVGRPDKSVKKSAPINDREERKTRTQVAKLAGVSHDTISKAKFVRDNADEETKAALRTRPDLKLHRVAKEIKETQQREARQEKRVEAAKSSPKLDSRIIVGDFRQHADKIADGSISLIFTDPPYDREASRMLPDLAKFAAAKLADGGSLICYVGHTQLPAAMDALRLHLRYWWTVACVHSGGKSVMREYGINACWKPVLWFVKGTRDNNSIMVNDVMSGGEEKSHHDWQQSQSEAEYWIDKLCPSDGIVCDPFLGGGTSAAAANKLRRKWIGFEVNPESAAIASGRIAG